MKPMSLSDPSDSDDFSFKIGSTFLLVLNAFSDLLPNLRSKEKFASPRLCGKKICMQKAFFVFSCMFLVT